MLCSLSAAFVLTLGLARPTEPAQRVQADSGDTD